MLLRVQRFQFYLERFNNHVDSLAFAEELLTRAETRMQSLIESRLSHADDEFLVSYVTASGVCCLRVVCACVTLTRGCAARCGCSSAAETRSRGRTSLRTPSETTLCESCLSFRKRSWRRTRSASLMRVRAAANCTDLRVALCAGEVLGDDGA